ncbi:MAG TPA: Gfo/Idh/MocA family oxidoreductase [Armatimonadota bacterium]|nr:Gfo/Idh/MocA family oxidoreductase [Armatimonadota bacterium]
MGVLRVGIVGAGMAAGYHVVCLRRVYGVAVEIAGVTSLRAESRQTFGAARGIPVYASLEAMLDHVDVVDICTPPACHLEGIRLAARAGKHLIVEKPLTGYFGRDDAFRGDRAPKAPMLEAVLEALRDIAALVAASGATFGYAENFVYAPAVQRERELVERTGAQILRMLGEESHNGSHAPVYGIWRHAGGGSLIGKGCHPLGALLYLKRREGIARDGHPIRPVAVSARTHALTRLPGYQDRGYLRTDYTDVEDTGWMHVIFADGTVGDVVTGEVTLGGIYDYVEVFANNHRARCRLSPTNLLDLYNPGDPRFDDLYLMEKLSTHAGWNAAAPDEHWTMGYQEEIQDFLTCAADGRQAQSDLALALDTTAVIYAAYLSAERTGAEVDVPLVQ